MTGDDISQFLQFADQDGAFRGLASAMEHRTARVSDTGGEVDISASGGDPITAARLVAIFEHFVQREFDRDVEARREEFGDDAGGGPSRSGSPTSTISTNGSRVVAPISATPASVVDPTTGSSTGNDGEPAATPPGADSTSDPTAPSFSPRGLASRSQRR